MKEILKKAKGWSFQNRKIIWFAVIVAAVSGCWTFWRGSDYSASLSILISRVASAQPIDYNYDSYYALKATDEFGNSIAGWFKTPEVVNSIYKRAGVDLSPSSFSGFSSRFKAIKVSASAVELRFGCSSLEEAKKISKAVDDVIGGKSKQLADLSKQGINFVILAGEPVVIKNSWDVWQKALAGFLAGLVFGIFLKKGKEFLEENS